MEPFAALAPLPGRTQQRPFALGRVFYVSSYGTNADDEGAGDDPNHPLTKVQTALGKCVKDRNDYVFVMDAWSVDDEPITFAEKDRVHVIGMSNSPLALWVVMPPGTDESVFKIGEDNHIEIAGFCLGGGEGHGGIEAGYAGAQAMGLWLHHNVFGMIHPGAGTPLYGIFAKAPGCPYSVIEDNVIHGDNSVIGLIDGEGMLLEGIGGGIIRRNIFLNLTAINLQVTGSIGAIIVDNQFAIDGNTAGRAITLTDCDGCWIDNNRVQFGKTEMAASPFADNNAGNHWGYNPTGDTVKLPA